MEVIEDQDIDQNINFDVFDIWLVVINETPIEYFGQKINLESAIILAGGKVNDTETSQDYFIEQSYLSLSWWLLNKGWLKISDLVEKVVTTEKFNTINARTELSINKFDDLLCEMVNELSTNHNQEILNAVFVQSVTII